MASPVRGLPTLDPRKAAGPGLMRSVRALLDAGIVGASTGAGTLTERIHAARTTCKKVRAALHLAQATDAAFVRRQNHRLRDAARTLAHFRDAHALLAAARLLRPKGTAQGAAVLALRRELAGKRSAELADRRKVLAALDEFVAELKRIRVRVRRWHPRLRQAAEVAPRLVKLYRRARRCARKLDPSRPAAPYHEWRKAVKELGYQGRFLGCLPRARQKGLERLGHVLGSEHDLTLLREHVLRDAPIHSIVLLPLIDRHRQQLRREAHRRARPAFATKSKAFERELLAHWERRTG